MIDKISEEPNHVTFGQVVHRSTVLVTGPVENRHIVSEWGRQEIVMSLLVHVTIYASGSPVIKAYMQTRPTTKSGEPDSRYADTETLLTPYTDSPHKEWYLQAMMSCA